MPANDVAEELKEGAEVPALGDGESEDDVMADGTKRGLRRTPQKTNRILAMERRRDAVQLRKAGWTYPEIAKQLKYASVEGARKAVMKGMKELGNDGVQELREMNVARLEHLLSIVWPSANAGDHKSIIMAQSIINDLNRISGGEVVNPGTVNNNVGVVVVDGDKEEFIRHLQAMAGEADALEALAAEAATKNGDDDDDEDDIIEVESWEEDRAAMQDDDDPVVAKAKAVLEGRDE